MWEIHNGPLKDGELVDHFDRDKTNNKIANLRSTTNAVNTRNARKSRNNSTGVNGVAFVTRTNKSGNESSNYVATWMQLDGIEKQKSFACKKYGDEEAFRMACEYREKMIEELNKQGAGYTERHGVAA